MSHSIDEGLIVRFRIDFNFGRIRELILRVFVREGKVCLFLQLSLEGYVEIYYLAL